MRKAFLPVNFFTALLVGMLIFSPSCKDENPVEPPVDLKAAFSAEPFEGHSPLAVQFTDESTGTPTSWKWDFQGDNIFDAFNEDPAFTYDEPGFFDVTLVAGNSDKSDTLTIIGYIYLNRDDEQLNYAGTLKTGVGELAEIPVRIGHDATFGAITLSLLYDNRIMEVTSIEGVMSGYLSNIHHENGSIFAIWSSVSPLVMTANDLLFTIKATILTGIGPVSHYIRIGPGTEFADASATIIPDVELIVPYMDSRE